MEISSEVQRHFKTQFLKRAKFAMISTVATIVDLLVYAIIIYYIFASSFHASSRIQMTVATAIAALFGMVVNFFLQKKYVFSLKRSLGEAFMLSILVSAGAIILEALIVYFLAQIDFFHSSLLMKMVPKIIAMIIIFFIPITSCI